MDPVFVLAAPKTHKGRAAATPDEIDAFYDDHGLEGLAVLKARVRRIAAALGSLAESAKKSEHLRQRVAKGSIAS